MLYLKIDYKQLQCSVIDQNSHKCIRIYMLIDVNSLK